MINIKYHNNYAYQLLGYQFILIVQIVFGPFVFLLPFCLGNLVLEFDYSTPFINASHPALNVHIKNEYVYSMYRVLPILSHSF